jgi:hypothetical protein
MCQIAISGDHFGGHPFSEHAELKLASDWLFQRMPVLAKDRISCAASNLTFDSHASNSRLYGIWSKA